MHSAVVFSPHADDAASFCGGTLAKFVAEGWRVILVRVTDDAQDSVGLRREETLKRNRNELYDAARHLGISEVVNLDFPTDSLADVPLTTIRERCIYCIRKYKPYAVFSFDPFAPFEGNQDHLRVAQAVDEAFWTACFDLHHPEHFEEGLAPFSVCERWYFARSSQNINYAVEISDHIEAKIAAMAAHETMMRNVIQQYRLQLKTWGRSVPLLDAAMQGEHEMLLSTVLKREALAKAQSFNMGDNQMAELFRLERFGDLEEFFFELSEKLPDAPESPKRPGFDIESTD